MSNNHSIIFFIDDKLGGVSSLNYNLIKKRPAGSRPLVIHIDHAEERMTRAGIDYIGCDQLYFHTSNAEHRIHALKRLHELVPEQPGALILNYGTEMAMLDHFPVRQTTYQLVHDNFNVELARNYGHVVDVFICHNSHIQKQLQQLMPHRTADIFFLPHGIELPEKYRQAGEANQPLRLLFLGRMTRTKGIFDLPVIAQLLRSKGVEVEWGCVGSGPELEQLKQSWDERDRVQYFSPATNAEVMELIAGYDVFVLPTKFEGSPVSLLETMGAGLVPVISKIPGGITDVVDDTMGFTPPMDDNAAFADAIEFLNSNRSVLYEMSSNCREKIKSSYDLNVTAASYINLINDYAAHHHPKKLLKRTIGSRLDKKWIPPFITHLIRGRRLKGNN